MRVREAVLICLVASTVAGCASKPKEDPILRLSSDEAFAEGRRLMGEEKYVKAQEYLGHAFQVAPNSEVGREALILQADALFQAGGEQNFIKAEAKYRDFINRFPTSELTDYAQFKLAESLEQRMRKPDRDQKATRDALAAYETLLEQYPLSEYVEPAREGIARTRTNLAEHEFLVGKYQLRRGLTPAAVNRFETLLDWYPDYPEIDKVLLFLGRAYHRQGEEEKAAESFARLRADYPQSPYREEIPKEYGTS